MKKITVEQFEKERSGSSVCLDVREPAEIAESRVEGFDAFPLSQLSDRTIGVLAKDRPTFLLCRSGNRACQAADRLEKAGFSDVRVIEGGLGAWEAAGRKVIKGVPKVWSLERQVRFAAGLLVLTGILSSLWVHPWAIGLSIFVAAGLMYSALSDTCGMGMILARCPWNQAK